MTRLWARFLCGGCGRGFTADPEFVPVFPDHDGRKWPCCLRCWDLRNRLRVRIGEAENLRPKAYPEDYEP